MTDAIADLLPGEHYCVRCKRRTRWLPVRTRTRTSYQRCESCGERMPCRDERCNHADCVTYRQHHAATVRP